MANAVVQVPVSLLRDPDRTAALKVLWMALRLSPTASPAKLADQTGLTARTVRDHLPQVRAWQPSFAGPRVRIPSALLPERSVGAQAKVLYGLLQGICGGQHGQFTYPQLSTQCTLALGTVRRAMADLAATGWIQLVQRNRLAPIRFTLGTPELRRSQMEAAVVRRRLRRAQYRGEALMQEYLSLLIAAEGYTDNARPGFLVNPLTEERLELDRFYLPDLAFEFNGQYHDSDPGQRLRDLLKAGLCVHHGIDLVIIRAKDLTLAGMMQKIGQRRPRRDLAGKNWVVDVLEEASILYQAGAPRSARGT